MGFWGIYIVIMVDWLVCRFSCMVGVLNKSVSETRLTFKTMKRERQLLIYWRYIRQILNGGVEKLKLWNTVLVFFSCVPIKLIKEETNEYEGFFFFFSNPNEHEVIIACLKLEYTHKDIKKIN